VAASIAWLAARHLDFPSGAAAAGAGEGGAAGGPLGRAAAGLVAGLVLGGAGRAAADHRAAGQVGPARCCSCSPHHLT